MSDVKLKAALPKDDEANGLAGSKWADEFDSTDKPVLALVVLQTEEVTEKRASHSRIPKIAITRIEPITDAEEAAELLERMQVLAEKRNGVTRLDIPEPPRLSTALDFDGPEAA